MPSAAGITTVNATFDGEGGSYLNQFGSYGSANGHFSQIGYVAIDSGGNVWVTDEANNRVQEFNSSGTWLQSIGGPSPYTCETSPPVPPRLCFWHRQRSA